MATPAYNYNIATQTMIAKNYTFTTEKNVKLAKGKVVSKAIFGNSWAVCIQTKPKQTITYNLEATDYEWLPYMGRGAEIQLRVNNTDDTLKSKAKVYKLQVTDRMRKGLDSDPNWGACMRDMPVQIDFATTQGINLIKDYPGQTVQFGHCTIVKKLSDTNTYVAKNGCGTKFVIKFRGTAQVKFRPGDKFGTYAHCSGVFVGEKTINGNKYIYFQD